MNRRNFLGTLLGVAVTPLVAPKTFVSMWIPKPVFPAFTLQELHKAIAKATFGAQKPSIILMTQEQISFLYKQLAGNVYLDDGITQAGYCNARFNGINTTWKNEERPMGFWKEDFLRFPQLQQAVVNPLDVTKILGRPDALS